MGTDPAIKILVVDDDPDICSMISTFLTANGYQTFTAPDAVSAWPILESEPVNLMITDLMMPHLDGIHFTEQVRANPHYRDLSIILVTAYPSDEIMDKGMRKGVALTLAKPIDLNKLLDLVGFATH